MTNEFQNTIPLLVCADIAATHDFLVAAFGAEPGGVERDGDGSAVHGEVRFGEATIWLHRVVDDIDLSTPANIGAATGGLVVWVHDVDTHYARAKAAGAEVIKMPTEQPYGQREYEVRDPDGHRWWFATPTR